MRKEKLAELQGYIETLKVKKSSILEKSGKFIKVERYVCELNNGLTIPREKIIKGKSDGSAAIILPITKEENILLVVQPRVFTTETVCVELPAGYIEKGEDPLLAGKRELAEETGYVPENMQLLASYYQDQGCSSAYNYSFLATNCQKKYQQNLDQDEYIHYFECQYEEALELIDLGYITDVNSILTLEKAKKYIKTKK